MIGRRDVLSGAVATGASFVTAGASVGSVTAAGSSAGGSSSAKHTDGLALALGGGAAKAFAHIPVLEALDELGVRPDVIAGTSMGAILGGFYASGMSGREVRRFTVELFTKKTQLFQKLFLTDGRTWGSLFNVLRPSIIDPIVLFETVFPAGLAATFEDLQIPMKIIATDFHTQSETVLASGPLLPAIAASSALPMLLTPVVIDGQVLIDGGFVNPTPFDVFNGSSYTTVAVDVTSADFSNIDGLPSGMETWVGSMSITFHSLVAAKLACRRPDVLIEPPIGRFKTMDFFKIESLLTAADSAKDLYKRQISAVLEPR